jgi:hypothetical protein
MPSVKCRGHIRPAPSHYDHLLDRVCHRLHPSFLIMSQIHQRCRQSSQQTTTRVQPSQSTRSLQASLSHAPRSLPLRNPLPTPHWTICQHTAQHPPKHLLQRLCLHILLFGLSIMHYRERMTVFVAHLTNQSLRRYSCYLQGRMCLARRQGQKGKPGRLQRRSWL